MENRQYKLFNGDCFEIMEQLINEGVQVDAIICDPPYNIDIAEWDNNFDFERVCELCHKLLKDNGNLILFQGWSCVAETKQIFDKKFKLFNWIIWDRLKGRGASKNLVSTREDILWYCKGDNPTYRKIYSNIEKKTAGMGTKNGEDTRALTNVWYDISPIVPWSSEKTEHPSQKPVELMERCITIWTNSNDLVLDFTMGSGSTGVAALNLNRRFIGIERDTEWFNVASNRIEHKDSKINEDEDFTEDF